VLVDTSLKTANL